MPERDPQPASAQKPLIPATVITISDRTSRGEEADRSGPLAVELLAAHGVITRRMVVADEPDQINKALAQAVAAGSRVVLTTGGTGLGPRDVTVQTVQPMLSYLIPGIAEEIRRRGAEHVASALLSRGVAGVILRPGQWSVFVITAPGSTGGVRDTLAVVGPLLAHIVDQLDGGGHPHDPSRTLPLRSAK